ncbi:hypothetical protein L9F63_027868, partial [Diploptera punctata]
DRRPLDISCECDTALRMSQMMYVYVEIEKPGLIGRAYQMYINLLNAMPGMHRNTLHIPYIIMLKRYLTKGSMNFEIPAKNWDASYITKIFISVSAIKFIVMFIKWDITLFGKDFKRLK